MKKTLIICVVNLLIAGLSVILLGCSIEESDINAGVQNRGDTIDGVSKASGYVVYSQWRFDETTEDAYGRFPGKLITTQSDPYVSGKFQKTINFDGATYVRIPDHGGVDMGSDHFSIHIWVKTSSKKTNNTIIDKRTTLGYHVTLYRGVPLLQMDNGPKAYNYYPAVNPANAFNDGQWHLLTISVERGSTTGVKIYKDLDLIYTGNATIISGTLSNTSPLYIGKHSDSSANNFQGLLDDVSIEGMISSEWDVEKNFKTREWLLKLHAEGDVESDNSAEGYSHLLMRVGVKNGVIRREFMRLYNSEFPENVVINQATAKLYIDYPNTNKAIAVHRVTSYVPLPVDWNNHPSYVPNYSYLFYPQNEGKGFISFDITRDMRNWYDGTTPNYGYLLKMVHEDTNTEGYVLIKDSGAWQLNFEKNRHLTPRVYIRGYVNN